MTQIINTISRYGIWGFFRLIQEVIFTKVIWPQARIMRRPIDVRGRKWIKIGNGFTTGRYCRIEAILCPESATEPSIEIGENVQINDLVHIAAIDRVKIGRDTLIASKVFIADHDHGTYSGTDQHSSPNSVPADRLLKSAPVDIGERVWIGDGVAILKGVTIGSGAIIASNSVVTRDVEPSTIVAGIPAKPVKKFNQLTQKWEK